MVRKSTFFILWAIQLVLTFDACGQNLTTFSPFFVNYDLNNGLPSTETYHVIQDTKKNIWIATDNGVSKFDGIKFTTFNQTSGLTDNTVYKLFEDHLGRIWCSTANNKICYIENDKVHPYKYNDLIRSSVPKNAVQTGLVYDKAGTLHLAFSTSGYYIVNKTGELFHFGSGTQFDSDKEQVYYALVENQLISFNYGINRKIGEELTNERTIYFVQFKEGNFHKKQIATGFISKGARSVQYGEVLKDGSSLLINGDKLWHFDEHNTKVTQIETAPGQIYVYDDVGGIWLGLLKNGAKMIRSDGTDLIHVLKDNSVSSICRDHEGGMWFTTLEDGLFYTPTLEVETLPTSKNSFPTRIIYDPVNENLLLSYFDGRLDYIDDALVNTKDLSNNEPSNYSYSFTADPFRNVIHLNAGFPFTIDGFKVNPFHPFPDRLSNISIKYLNFLDPNHYYVVTYGSVALIKNNTIQSNHVLNVKVNATQVYKNKLYLGTNEGLMMYNGEKLVKIASSIILEDLVISSLELYKDKLIIGCKQGTLYEYTIGKGIYKYPNFTNTINCLHLEGERLWVGTGDGLYNISVKERKQNFTIGMSDGLPSSTILDIEHNTKYLFVLTREGLTRIPNKYKVQMKAPRISVLTFFLKDTPIAPSKSLTIPHDYGSIRVEYNCLAFKHRGKIKYRYILKGYMNDYLYTSENHISFAGIPSGEYQLEISSSYDGIHYGKSIKYDFNIEPPWWKSIGFIVILIFLSLTMGSIFVWFLNKRMKNRNEQKRRIVELRSRALNANMNPHFTFNVLNSIQSLISQNNNEMATIYLAKFSRLMRLTLESSSNNLISLEDETKLSVHYMELEKLRFKENIEFSLSIDDNVDQLGIKVPPMIIQPFIENAVIHGVGKVERVGRIDLNISIFDERYLIIKIKDNGAGIQNEESSGDHDSKGVKLTIERIQLLDPSNSVEITSKDNEGVLVQIKIRMNA